MMCERWFAVVSFTTEDRKAAARRAALPSLQARENYNPTFRFPSIVPASAQRGHRAAPGGELGPPAKNFDSCTSQHTRTSCHVVLCTRYHRALSPSSPTHEQRDSATLQREGQCGRLAEVLAMAEPGLPVTARFPEAAPPR